MSELIDTLAIILHWIETNETDGPCLLPGLTIQDIHKKASSFPFIFPREVQELYQWRNGLNLDRKAVSQTLGFMNFFPLEKAVKEYHNNIAQFRQYGIIWYRQWFPIFQTDTTCLFVSCSKQQEKSSPIFCYDFKDYNDIRPNAMYCNLASMMRTIAECWNTGAYYMTESPYVPGSYAMEYNFDKTEEIRLKYNPNVEELRDSLIPEDEFWNKKYLDDI